MSYAADLIYDQKLAFRFRRPMATRKNLFCNFVDEDSISPSEDAIKVFLRLKPTPIESNIIQVLDSRTLLFKMPQEFMQARNKLNMPDEYKYSFSQIYQPETTQSEIYTGCVAPLVKDLFNGQHCLLFTYGTTNAGKTFTVLGNGDNPGIIPRTLSTVFKSILGKEYKNDHIMPDKFNSAIEVTETTLSEERRFKEVILTWKSSQVDSKLHKTTSTMRSSVDEIFGESVFREMQKRLTNDTSIVEYKSSTDDRFSVWISFAEIYNEAIYDLLQPISQNSKRKPLKLGQDNNKNYYIKGLKHIFVQSEEEAYKVLMFGKTNLQVAATGMNSRSSRSHCIFTIKLVKSPNVEHPERVVVSSFSICDLAGAERQKKTLNVGLRLKESQNINCSLHVLSRCFTIIRENQLSSEPKMIPFRDSKLTQLFRHALTGKETVTMIVNVNSDLELCEETQHVLKASAVAKHIVVQPRKAKLPSRETRQSLFSQIVKHNRSTLIRWDSCVKNKETATSVSEDLSSKNDLEEKKEDYENLLALVEDLKEKLKEEKAKHNETKMNWLIKEDEIRNEMKDELTRVLKQTGAYQEETTHSDYKMKKRRLSSEEMQLEAEGPVRQVLELNTTQTVELSDLQEEIKIQQKQIDSLTNFVNILRDEKKELSMELTLAQLNLSHRERDVNSLKAKIEMFKEESNLHEKYLAMEKEMEEKLKVRDDLLNEAKEDLLEEMRAKDDLEEEIAKLEKEFMEKEEQLLFKIENLKEKNISYKEDIELLEAKLEYEEYIHKEDVKSLNIQISSLEEEIIRHTKEYNILKQDIAGRKNNSSELKEEQTVNNLEQELKARDENIRQLKEDLVEKILNIQDLKQELLKKNEEAELNKSIIERKDKEWDLLKTKLESELTNLTQKLKNEEDKACSISSEFNSKCHSLQDMLAKMTEENKLLQESIESLSTAEIKMKEEYNSEVTSLEQSCKESLKEITRLRDSLKTKDSENEKLVEELSKMKKILADLNESFKAKEHELKCFENQMTGYKNLVPALQTQFEMQRKELSEYKKKCDDQKETIINMEKELNSFQANQREIIGKYEDNLKKTKEENESLKKEVARVTTTFYKSTPTPKKILEKQLDEQRAQIGELKKLLDEREVELEKLQKQIKKLNGQLEESIADRELNKGHYSKTKGARTKTLQLGSDVVLRQRALSCEEQSNSDSALTEDSRFRSTRTTRTAMAVPTVTVTDADNSQSSEIKSSQSKKPSRKKLLYATFNDGKEFEDDELHENIPEDSPGTYYKRTLRSRKK